MKNNKNITSDARKGGEFVGESHSGKNGGMRAIVVDNGKQPILVEGQEVIINKKSANSKKVLTVKGKPKEILSTINQLEGGVPIGDEEAEILAKYKNGGKIPNFSKMSKSEIKEFYDSPEGKKLDAETYKEWSNIVNMSKSELEKFYNSELGKKAGLSRTEANKQGISSGRESAKWILKMKDIPYTKWTPDMWRWAKKQISFIKRMSGAKGDLRDENNKPTRKLLALKIWGNNPEKFKFGGTVGNKEQVDEAINLALTIPKYSDLTKKEAKYLFYKFKRYDLLEKYDDEYYLMLDEYDVEENREMLEKLTSLDYIYFSEWNDSVTVQPKLIEFIDQIYVQTDKVIGIENNFDLFSDNSKEMEKGIKVEEEHRDTLEDIAKGKITVDEAIEETVKSHLSEDADYYDKLEVMELESLRDKLKNQGYNVTIPSGSNRISVMGYGKGYFNAKKQKAESILSSLKNDGYNAISELDSDGYYDFWVYEMESKKQSTSIKELIEALEILEETELVEALRLLDDDKETFEGGGSIGLEVPKYAIIDDEIYEVISTNEKLNIVKAKDFVNGDVIEMSIENWYKESFELGTQAKFESNGVEYVGQVVMKNGQKSISLYKDDNYSGDKERVVSFRDIDLKTLKPTMKKETFAKGGEITNSILKNGYVSIQNIKGKELCFITYNSGGQENLSVNDTINTIEASNVLREMKDLCTNSSRQLIYEHITNSNRIETKEELDYYKNMPWVIILDRDKVELNNTFAKGGELKNKGNVNYKPITIPL